MNQNVKREAAKIYAVLQLCSCFAHHKKTATYFNHSFKISFSQMTINSMTFGFYSENAIWILAKIKL